VFETVQENAEPVATEATGTTIEVSALHASVADSSVSKTSTNNLRGELADAHAASIEKGLAITINQIPINFMPQKLFSPKTFSRPSPSGISAHDSRWQSWRARSRQALRRNCRA